MGVKWAGEEWLGRAPVYEGKSGGDGLARGAANSARGAARDAEADDKNDEEYGNGSGGGAREEIEENVIEAHGREYGTGRRFERGYEEAWPKVRRGQSGASA